MYKTTAVWHVLQLKHLHSFNSACIFGISDNSGWLATFTEYTIQLNISSSHIAYYSLTSVQLTCLPHDDSPSNISRDQVQAIRRKARQRDVSVIVGHVAVGGSHKVIFFFPLLFAAAGACGYVCPLAWQQNLINAVDSWTRKVRQRERERESNRQIEVRDRSKDTRTHTGAPPWWPSKTCEPSRVPLQP